jgi:proline dehydrogenase
MKMQRNFLGVQMNRIADDSRWALPDLSSALNCASERCASGMLVTFDHLGEYARNESQASENAANYLTALDGLKNQRLNASLAIKLSALGLTFSYSIAEKHLNGLFKSAEHAGLVIEIDIEGTPSVQAVCEIAKNASMKGFKTVLALQAYLERTSEDISACLEAGLKIRLVKGAYKGDIEDFGQIQKRFLTLAEQLLASGRPFDVGTHDPLLLKAIIARLGQQQRDKVCFGFLKGLADKTKVEMSASGYQVSEYLPFGENRSAYVARRHAYLKRLANLNLDPAP